MSLFRFAAYANHIVTLLKVAKSLTYQKDESRLSYKNGRDKPTKRGAIKLQNKNILNTKLEMHEEKAAEWHTYFTVSSAVSWWTATYAFVVSVAGSSILTWRIRFTSCYEH